MIWMITLHKGFVKSFLAGEKDIELRTRVPKALRPGDIVLVAQAGTHNKVVMRMSVLSAASSTSRSRPTATSSPRRLKCSGSITRASSSTTSHITTTPKAANGCTASGRTTWRSWTESCTPRTSASRQPRNGSVR